MRLLVLASLLGFALSAPSGGYSVPSGGGGSFVPSCGPDEVRQVDGSCVRPQVSRSVYVYRAPQLPVSFGPPPPIPKPKINYNVVFVRTPEVPVGPGPVIVSPQERTIIYILTKKGQVGQQVIEVPAGPGQTPEVYYVNYNEGDNPTLPGGISLQEALNSVISQNGQLIGGAGGEGGGGGFNSGGIGGGQISQTYAVP